MEKYISADSVASMLEVSKSYVLHNWKKWSCKPYKVRTIKLGGRLLRFNKDDISKLTTKLIINILIIFILPLSSIAKTSYPENLWKAIIAEDTSPDSYREYLAIACCYRNRLKKGMSLGCVAAKRTDLDSFVLKNVNYVKLRFKKPIDSWAKKAVKEAFLDEVDIVAGADHYENIEAFGVASWAKQKTVVCKIGKHTFFK